MARRYEVSCNNYIWVLTLSSRVKIVKVAKLVEASAISEEKVLIIEGKGDSATVKRPKPFHELRDKTLP